MNENHNEIIQRYRTKLKETKKRIEFWIDQPICLDVLVQLSGENKTKVLNFLLEVISDAFDPEFSSTDEEREKRIKTMIFELKDYF